MRVEEIQDWLVGFVAALLEVEPAMIDVAMPFEQLGVDSATTLVLSADLEEWLGLELSPVEVFRYPTIRSLTERVAVGAPLGV